MKYEMIFGDDDSFDQQNNAVAEVKLWHDCLGPNFVSIKELSRMNLDGAIPHGSVVLAMRRIIAEPKRWTWEDKKAGRLPEVGAKYFDKNKRVCEFLFSDAEGDLWGRTDKNMASCTSLQLAFPIETTEEKEQREEDEFISSLRSVEIHDGTVSGSFNQGARAAYRKLKGGE